MRFPLYISQNSPEWSFFGHLLNILGQLALLKLVAILWGTTVFGQLSLVMAVVAVVGTVFFGPFAQWVIRDYQGVKEKNELREFFHVGARYLTITSSIVVIVAVLVMTIAAFYDQHILGVGPLVLLMATVLGIGVTLSDLLFSLFNAERLTRRSAVYAFTNHGFRILTILVIFGLGLGFQWIVGGLLSVQFLMVVVGYVGLMTSLRRQEAWCGERAISGKIDLWSDMYKYSRPFFIWGIFGYVATMGDRWILATYISAHDLGTYTAMLFVSMGLTNAIYAAVNQAVMPVVFRMSGYGSDQQRIRRSHSILTKVVMALVCLSGFLTALSFFFPEKLLIFFTSREFVSQGHMLWLLMLAAAAFNLSQFMITRGLINRTPSMYLPSKILHGIITLAGLAFLIPGFGVAGAVYAVLTGNVLNLLMVMYINKRVGASTEKNPAMGRGFLR